MGDPAGEERFLPRCALGRDLMKIRALVGAAALAGTTLATTAAAVPSPVAAQEAAPVAAPGFVDAPPQHGPTNVGPESFSPLATVLGAHDGSGSEAGAPE